MGVTYKLKDEVVHFIISQRQGNPLFSCRQLAESASQKFGVHLSKSSVHDVLKESGIVTPRGRKPKDKFEIPHEKKKQIQSSLAQVKILTVPSDPPIKLLPGIIESNNVQVDLLKNMSILPEKKVVESSPEYQGAGKIFLKAAFWDLGIYSEENIKPEDWAYYLTYTKGVKIFLENGKDFFIELRLPLERCIREVVDGLVNKIRPLIVDKVSDQELFEASMGAHEGFKIIKIVIVDRFDHEISDFSEIMEYKIPFYMNNRIFMESNSVLPLERARSLFFSQVIDINGLMEEILNLHGFDSIAKDELVVNLIVKDSNIDRGFLKDAADRLNRMFLYDEKNRLVKIKIQE